MHNIFNVMRFNTNLGKLITFKSFNKNYTQKYFQVSNIYSNSLQTDDDENALEWVLSFFVGRKVWKKL